jgi:hypothetical protein
VVETLLEVAYLHEGTFRDEVGRALRSIGDRAVPALVRSAAFRASRPSEEDSLPARKAEYARIQLDRLGRRHPAHATAAVATTPTLLVALLEAYGEVRDPDAAPVLLEHADHGDPIVRRTARHAFAAYVEGPAPRVGIRSVRLLGGGIGTTTTATFRGRAAAAIRERVATVAPERLEPPCELRLADGTPDLACEDQPARHTRLYFEVLDRRRAEARQVELTAALAEPEPMASAAALDAILATDPEVVPVATAARIYGAAADLARSRVAVADEARLRRKLAALTGLEPEAARARELERSLVAAGAQGPDPSDVSSPLRSGPPHPRFYAAWSAWSLILMALAWLGARGRRLRPRAGSAT